MQLLPSLVSIYCLSMLSMYLHTSISTSKSGYCYDSKSNTSELTLVCIPKVRKNRIRWVMKRRRCPGSTLLSLESHLPTSSIKPITTKEMSALAVSQRKRKTHLRNISKFCIYSTSVIQSQKSNRIGQLFGLKIYCMPSLLRSYSYSLVHILTHLHDFITSLETTFQIKLSLD